MINFAHMGSTEILQIADAVAREKGIMRDAVIDAIAHAIQVVSRRKYGHEHNIHVDVDRKTGEISLFRALEVVEEVADPITQITLEEAKQKQADIKLGDSIYEPLPPIDLGRLAAQTAKQVIVKRIQEEEREKQYQTFLPKIGTIGHGTVKRIENNRNIIIDLGQAEGLLRNKDLIPNENLRQGDRIRAYIEDVRRENKGPQIFLSRTHNQFLARLFAQEVPEIYDNVIEVKGVAREPGSRAKIAVYSRDTSIDPVGSCVGVRGARVQAVINELQGEKIDIVPWSPEPATFVVNALAPAEISKVVIDEVRHRIEVVVGNDQLSLAIGRRGQNVRLASQLCGWHIDVLTEEEESKRRVEEFNTVSSLFMQALDVEEVLAHLLVAEGFTSIEDVAYVPIEDLANIEGFDRDLAEALKERASNYLERQAQEQHNQWVANGVELKLLDLPGMSADMVSKLMAKQIKTVQQLADLSRSEFKELVPQSGLQSDEIDNLIMAARALEESNE